MVVCLQELQAHLSCLSVLAIPCMIDYFFQIQGTLPNLFFFKKHYFFQVHCDAVTVTKAS